MSIKRVFIFTVLFFSVCLNAGTQDTVYCLMGHGGHVGDLIQKLYDAGYKYATGVGCELNARLGLINAKVMETNIPGYPAQFWTYGTHFDKGGVDLNPYNNAGYDPMFSLTLRPHKFAEDEYDAFLVDVDSATPLLKNWGAYLNSYMIAEKSVAAMKDMQISVINSVGAMRDLQQVWLASMNKAVELVMGCKDCDSVDLVFSYDMSESYFYELLYAYAKNSFYQSDKESLDYKILVLKEDIHDGSKVELPSGKIVEVPKGYIENLKNNYPINYEKNLRADGSIRFESITCDELTGLKSVPDVIKGNGEKKVYKITKDVAVRIRGSKCAEHFSVTIP